METDKKLPDAQSAVTFPKRFLWGAATAAHQVEGGTHNQWSIWELEHAKTKAAQAHYQYGDLESWSSTGAEAALPDNYVSAGLADHYHRYEEDFDLLEKMNLNTYRFSIEWSRVEPREGVWDAQEIEHYRTYLKALKKRSIEPVVTLFHFTLPVWFAQKGGFEKRRNVTYFIRYVEKMMEELGHDFRFVITINEPEVYAFESYYLGNWPPMQTSALRCWRVLRTLLYAHKQAARIIQATKKHKVSIAKNSGYFYAGDDAWLSRLSARVMQYVQDDYVLKRISRHVDFLGINYYQSYRVYGYRIHNPEQKLSDLGWDLAPADIEFVLERLHEKYKLPIIITENGLADGDDAHRQWWLTQTLLGINRALKRGVAVKGYLHWSLLDNFEWDKGKWPRFGLAAVDYSTGKRTLRPSALWFGKIIKKMRNK